MQTQPNPKQKTKPYKWYRQHFWLLEVKETFHGQNQITYSTSMVQNESSQSFRGQRSKAQEKVTH